MSDDDRILPDTARGGYGSVEERVLKTGLVVVGTTGGGPDVLGGIGEHLGPPGGRLRVLSGIRGP